VGGIGAYVAVSTPAAGGLFAIVAGVAALLCLAGIAIGRLDMVQWTVAGVAVAYVAALLYRSAATDALSPLIAVGLLLSSELASWSIDSRRRGLDDLVVHVGRVRSLAIAIVAALALVVVVQAAEQVGGGGSVAAALATAAVLVGTGAVCLLMWKTRFGEDRPKPT
jgi:hypothetical protein